jgi:hypothetical protein
MKILRFLHLFCTYKWLSTIFGIIYSLYSRIRLTTSIFMRPGSNMRIAGPRFKYFYTPMDGGLFYGNIGVLFVNCSRRRGIKHPGPLDQKHTTQIRLLLFRRGTQCGSSDQDPTVDLPHAPIWISIVRSNRPPRSNESTIHFGPQDHDPMVQTDRRNDTWKTNLQRTSRNRWSLHHLHPLDAADRDSAAPNGRTEPRTLETCPGATPHQYTPRKTLHDH